MDIHEPTALEQASLLLVDDDPGSIRLLSRVLAAYPNQRFAMSGEEALRLCRDSRPALILLDAELPDISGPEVFRQLQEDPSLKHCPVIFVTAHGSAELESQALEMGASDFLNKPVSPAQVNARVRAQLRLQQLADSRRELTERMQLALSTGELGVWEWKFESDQLIWDESMGRIRGRPASLVRHYRDHLSGLDDENQRRLRGALEQALSERRSISIEYSAAVGGQPHQFRSQLAATHDEDGVLARLIGVDQNITPAYQARLAIEGANRQLEQFASFASHDLQAPVRRIEAFAGLAQQALGKSDLPATRQQLQRISEDSELMRRQIRSFLDFARHRLSEPGEWQRTDLTALVGRIRAELINDLQERQVEWNLEPLGERLTSPNLVAHVWRNLISNAIRHNASPKPRIRVGRRGEGAATAYFVEDNGTGGTGLVSYLEHGVMPSASSHGTGVGLSLCRNLLRALGGRLWSETPAEGGTRVLFTLGDIDQP